MVLIEILNNNAHVYRILNLPYPIADHVVRLIVPHIYSLIIIILVDVSHIVIIFIFTYFSLFYNILTCVIGLISFS